MSNDQACRYLVTGAQGFVGSALCKDLKTRGHQVRALIRRPGNGAWDEQCVLELGKEKVPHSVLDGIDGVFHLAGVAHVQDIAGVPDAVYQRVNVDATKALLDAAASSGVKRFLYFSSVKAAADPPHERCVDERWDPLPTDAYGRSKRAAEQLVLAAGRDTDLLVCILRPCLVYGAGVKGNLARMIHAVERGRFPPLPEFHNRRSMVGLHDLVQAAWLAMNSSKANGQTYIVADAEPYSTRALFVDISCALNKPLPGWSIPRPLLHVGAIAGDLLTRLSRRPMPLNSALLKRLRGSACYRSDRIRDELGWTSKDRFRDLLPEIISGYD
ncbi:MAG: NAD-dependent epimerase/dehydratase family protein [Thiohalocapsa sp. PB-PSB1]|jgi:UDP-glucose 4-epimerase|nr:MAG: hypothetical protein N838_00505 [Thiohalocapsa sp. PB-PSB1]QQO56560.1 MAG: NAD-dependent epimerase/dehydratase family protein [Thiohalocapsa sp. PB-PSB1]HCS91300.1 NAD-dependent dehydratase [Chromatiaceae bacterium]